jgi:hypothetical protein
MNPIELQTAIFARLNDTSVTATLSTAYGVTAVFNEWVPQLTDGGDPIGFPFVTFSFPTSGSFDDKDAIGQDSVVQVDVWARTNGTNIKAISKAVYDRMHRQALGVTGHITTECTAMVFERDPDGITRRCRMSYRVLSIA